MEEFASKCGDFDTDIESGEATNGSGTSKEIVSSDEETRPLFLEASYVLGDCDESLKCEAGVTSSIGSSCSDGSLETVMVDNKIGGENNADLLGKKKGKPKAKSAKRPPKPPRPPRGLSLDSADQKLIRELAEVAKMKRARIERMKALKKMKDAKGASSKNQLLATLFTVFVCLVLLFQGISSRISSAASTQGSLMSSGRKRDTMISTYSLGNSSPSNTHGHLSDSPRYMPSLQEA
ncbi:hypothetical protein Nepgr_020068 [Nepenthes gracilis]|uniref:Uncharacterized protein n=1 Tax=Nepenthes gracilis TaxID=150966 RepID=A0AAD3SXA8_NEPGR|nr:hypothetical protein Nepgr_020068 [Nepenthes gracilis]